MSRFAGVSLFLAGVLLAGVARGEPPVWVVHGRHGQVVLFGSVHLLPRGVDWKPAALRQALAKADDLWFELPVNQATDETALRLAAARARLPATDSLWAYLTAAQRARVEQAAIAVGLPPTMLPPLRPWMADLTLSLAADARTGAEATAGVEVQLQAETPLRARRHALERVGQQIDFLAGGSSADQVASLDETAREITEDPNIYDRTVAEWLSGDLAGLEKDNLTPLKTAAPDTYRRLIADRNRRWARVLARLVNNGRLAVVVVGAGHLVGPEGVPALLRARGLRVEGP